MKLKKLGRTGLEVAEMSLGGAWFSPSPDGFPATLETIKHALDNGINYIDTAAGYGDSEEGIGKAFAELGNPPMIVSTKLGGRPNPFDARSMDDLKFSFDESLRLLGRDQIDILMIHEPDRWGEYDWWADLDTFTGPVTDFLGQLKDSGLIRFSGLGGTTAYELANIIRTGQFDVVLTAFNYSLLWREAEVAVIPACKEHNVGVIVGSPLQQGALTGRFDERVETCRWMAPQRKAQYRALYAYLDEIEMDIIECAMRFAFSNPDVDCVLTGARTVEQLDQNLEAYNKGPLPAEVLKRLDEIYAMQPCRPFEEPFGLPFGSDQRYPLGGAR
jgi:D-threo-aldose 1-dehydrogenase